MPHPDLVDRVVPAARALDAGRSRDGTGRCDTSHALHDHLTVTGRSYPRTDTPACYSRRGPPTRGLRRAVCCGRRACRQARLISCGSRCAQPTHSTPSVTSTHGHWRPGSVKFAIYWMASDSRSCVSQRLGCRIMFLMPFSSCRDTDCSGVTAREVAGEAVLPSWCPTTSECRGFMTPVTASRASRPSGCRSGAQAGLRWSLVPSIGRREH